MAIKKLFSLVSRNIKCYFKDRFLFLISLLTPVILLVLFVTFLRGVYIESIKLALFDVFSFEADERILNGLAGSWLLSSIIAVSAVTVAVCSNAVMIQDKIDNTIYDLHICPISGTTRALGYFLANFIVTLLVILSVTAIGFIYLAAVGWYIPLYEILLILVDIVLCVLFGTLLSAVIESFISSQGGLSAISTLVSSMYGFICGAYMPLSEFPEGVKNVLSVLPGTYSACVVRKHFLGGYIQKLGEMGLSEEGQNALMNTFDGNLYFKGAVIPEGFMYLILLGTCAVLLLLYIAIVLIKNRKKKKPVNRYNG